MTCNRSRTALAWPCMRVRVVSAITYESKHTAPCMAYHQARATVPRNRSRMPLALPCMPIWSLCTSHAVALEYHDKINPEISPETLLHTYARAGTLCRSEKKTRRSQVSQPVG